MVKLKFTSRFSISLTWGYFRLDIRAGEGVLGDCISLPNSLLNFSPLLLSMEYEFLGGTV